MLSAYLGRRHQSLGIAILEPELRAPQDAETRAGLEAVKLVWPIRRQYPAIRRPLFTQLRYSPQRLG